MVCLRAGVLVRPVRDDEDVDDARAVCRSPGSDHVFWVRRVVVVRVGAGVLRCTSCSGSLEQLPIAAAMPSAITSGAEARRLDDALHSGCVGRDDAVLVGHVPGRRDAPGTPPAEVEQVVGVPRVAAVHEHLEVVSLAPVSRARSRSTGCCSGSRCRGCSRRVVVAVLHSGAVGRAADRRRATSRARRSGTRC